jgi:DNA polymerase
MRAFVRFREIKLEPEPWFVAWFEPAHHIVERNATFFLNRFAAMHWSILTPDRCAHWDGTQLTFTAGVTKDQAPTDDTVEPLWLTYYAHIFNPARVKETMMQSEMAKKYWKNLPEAALIPELLSEAPKRVAKMRAASAAKDVPDEFHPAPVPASPDLEVVRQAALGCQACPLYRNATQTVFGEGLPQARVVFVGEQPGDQEDLAGKPFIGPAGALFDRALAEVGFDRSLAYVTNAVKHFKWEPRGKRRIHQKPNAREIAACRPWVERELEIIHPEILVCLGATATQSLLGSQVKLTRDRGQWLESKWAGKTIVTFHPSALLRAPNEEIRKQNYALFVSDLAKVLGALH